jgi:hypothetical protein
VPNSTGDVGGIVRGATDQVDVENPRFEPAHAERQLRENEAGDGYRDPWARAGDRGVLEVLSARRDFDLSKLGDDLLSQFLLSAWHWLPPLVCSTPRFSLWKWCCLRGAGQRRFRAHRPAISAPSKSVKSPGTAHL